MGNEIFPEEHWAKDNIEAQFFLINRALGIAQKANDPTMRRYYYDLEERAIRFADRCNIILPIAPPPHRKHGKGE